MAVSDWSTTPASNTTVDAVSIAEACPPGNLNDAIRAVMASVKAWYNTFSTFTRTLIGLTDAASWRSAIGAASTADVTAILAGYFSFGTSATGIWSKRASGAGGMIIEQWGIASTGTGGFGGAFDFPTAFTDVTSVVMTVDCTDPSYTGQISATVTSASQFQLGATGASTVVYWRAIGY